MFNRYGLGMLPVGEAFLAWSLNARPWIGPPLPPRRDWEPLMLPGWRFAYHLLTALLLAGLFSGEIIAAARRRRQATRSSSPTD